MAKRFTSTEKWDDAWFADRLTPAQRTAWQYLCDKCDLAGVADISVRNAALFVGNDFDWEEMVRVSEGRIERLPSGKLHLTGFVEFQYGQLNENCNAHRAVLKALDRHGLLKGTQRDGQPFPTPSGRDQDKDKDKDKDKDLEGGVGETKPTPFDAFWQAVPKKTGKQAAAKAYKAAVKAVRGRTDAPGGDDPHGFLLDRMTAFAASEKAQGQFCPHPATWLNRGQYDDDPATWRESRGSPSRIHAGPGQVYTEGSVSDGF